MTVRTGYEPGTFNWAELSTSDPDAAKQFYGEMFGWEPQDTPMPGEAGGGFYTMLNLNGQPAGALFGQREQERSQGIPPHWNSYISVEDADPVAERAKELGGEVLAEPFDVMDVGRMAILRDPSGGIVQIWQPRAHAGAGVVNDPGAMSWNELGTKDPEAAKKFFGDLFGWTYETDEQGYNVIMNKGNMNGGIRAQTAEEAEVPPNWLVYFTVANADESIGRATQNGATVLMPAMDIPMGRIAVLADPQGAAFAVFQGPTEA